MTNCGRTRAVSHAPRAAALRIAWPLLLWASAGHAEEAAAPRFSLDGFATFGWVHSTEDDADFVGALLIPEGAGHTRAWSAEVDSRLGLQLAARFTPRLSGVVQVIAEQQHDGSYGPRVEWANLRFDATTDFAVRIGRTVLANFLISDYRKVGYANPWVRPPVELYGLVPVTSSDGIDFTWRQAVGSVTHTLHADFGGIDTNLPNGAGKVRAREAWGLSDTLEAGALTARMSYRQGTLRVQPFNTLFDAFRQFGPEGIAVAERYDADGNSFHFTGLGASYDPGDWFLTGEWGRLRSGSAIGDRSSWYASAGYRWREFTPYVIHGRTRSHDHPSGPGLTPANYLPELADTVLALNAGLADLFASIPQQKTVSLGARWDFRQDFALKVQYDHTRVGDGSRGNLVNIQPGFRPGGDLDLLSVSVDFVF